MPGTCFVIAGAPGACMERAAVLANGGQTCSTQLDGGAGRHTAMLCFCGFPHKLGACWAPASLETLGEASTLWASVFSPEK